jgi:YVTN family beta-propeller protein
MNSRPLSACFSFLLAVCATTALHAAAPEYRVVARLPIPGDSGSYDYLRVDAAARRLYVTHDKNVEVLDADTGKVIGQIGGLTRAHGVALASEAGHGFATSGVDDQITMFDLKTLATLKQFKSTGSNPDAIEYDAGTKRVYVANHGSGDVTVLDPTSGDIVGTVKFGDGKLEGLAFDGRGQGFVNVEDKSSVYVFDLKTLAPKAKWSAAPGEGGTGLAIDAAHHRLFTACGNNKVVVLDSDSGKVVATPAIGDDPDGLVFEPATGRIFVSNVDGTLTIIQEDSADKYSVLQNVTTQRGCRTITLDEKTGHVVTCAPQYGPAPAAVKGGPRPRPQVLPGTFQALVVGVK